MGESTRRRSLRSEHSGGKKIVISIMRYLHTRPTRAFSTDDSVSQHHVLRACVDLILR